MKEKLNDLKWKVYDWYYPKRYALIIALIAVFAVLLISISLGNWFARNDIEKDNFNEEQTKIEEYEPVQEEVKKDECPVVLEVILEEQDENNDFYLLNRDKIFDVDYYTYKLACYDDEDRLMTIYDVSLDNILSDLKRLTIDVKNEENYKILQEKCEYMKLIEMNKLVRNNSKIFSNDDPSDNMRVIGVSYFEFMTE